MPSTITDRLQGLTTSVAVKPPCVAVTSANVTLSGLQGGAEGDRTLVRAQTNSVENGIYLKNTSDWTRAKDFDGARDVVHGTIVLVHTAATDGAIYEVTSANPVIIGTSAITFNLRDDPAITYDQIQAEIDALVTVVNHAYPPLYVDRYGTNTVPGTTSMVAAFNAACKVAKLSGQTVTYGKTWPYFLDAPIDCTVATGLANYGFTIRNEGQQLGATTNSPGYPSIIAKHTGHVFDCSGAPAINFENVSIGTDVTVYPKTGWFFARNSSGGSQYHRLSNCRTYGKFSCDVLYNYGAEGIGYENCIFHQAATDAGCGVVTWTTYNIRALSSTFITIATGSQVCTAHKVQGGQYINFSNSATSYCWQFEGIQSFSADAPFMLCFNGLALISVNLTNATSDQVTLTGIQSEGGTPPTYGITFSNVARTIIRWSIRNCNLSATTSMINVPALVNCDNWHVNSVLSSSGSPNLNFAGTLQNSHIDELAANILIGTDQFNVLNVSINNLTVTTRGAGSFWAGTTTQTWTPGTGAVTHGGTLTVSNKTVQYHGRQVTVTVSFTDSVSMSWVANAAITGLPATCVVGRGMVTVVNVSTGAQVGIGSISGTSILLPALAAGGTSEIAITATYFVAT